MFPILLALKPLHSIFLLFQPRSAPLHPSRARVSLVLSYFQGRTAPHRPKCTIRQRKSDDLRMPVEGRCILAENRSLVTQEMEMAQLSVGQDIALDIYLVTREQDSPTCFPAVNFLIFSGPIGSPTWYLASVFHAAHIRLATLFPACLVASMCYLCKC